MWSYCQCDSPRGTAALLLHQTKVQLSFTFPHRSSSFFLLQRESVEVFLSHTGLLFLFTQSSASCQAIFCIRLQQKPLRDTFLALLTSQSASHYYFTDKSHNCTRALHLTSQSHLTETPGVLCGCLPLSKAMHVRLTGDAERIVQYLYINNRNMHLCALSVTRFSKRGSFGPGGIPEASGILPLVPVTYI